MMAARALVLFEVLCVVSVVMSVFVISQVI